MKKLIAALAGAGLVLSAAPAFAGNWRLDTRQCPDIREDWRDARDNRRDERIDYGRRDRVEDRYDRREDRRDRAVTVCPKSAFYYVSDRGERHDNGWRNDDHRYGRNDRYDRYDRYDRSDRRSSNARGYRAPSLKLKYDRRLRMQYTTVTGRKIYVRG